MARSLKAKSSIDAEMAGLLHGLLGVAKVAVISGGDWPQFEKQVISHLPKDERLANLSLLPTCGTKFSAMTAIGPNLFGRFHRGPKNKDRGFSQIRGGQSRLQS